MRNPILGSIVILNLLFFNISFNMDQSKTLFSLRLQHNGSLLLNSYKESLNSKDDKDKIYTNIATLYHKKSDISSDKQGSNHKLWSFKSKDESFVLFVDNQIHPFYSIAEVIDQEGLIYSLKPNFKSVNIIDLYTIAEPEEGLHDKIIKCIEKTKSLISLVDQYSSPCAVLFIAYYYKNHPMMLNFFI